MKHKDALKIHERPAKAGVLLYELNEEGNRNFLVPYNEGRFSKNGRFLVLPKGSVDYSETQVIQRTANEKQRPKFDSSPLAGAIRETSEETGFPLETFLGKRNIRRLERRETLRHITNPDFPGFEIVKACPRAFPHTYHARGGIEQSMVMYGFEVKGLEAIAHRLKNSDGKTTKLYLDERPEIPRFSTFLEWMKQGYIPAKGNLPEVKLFEPGEFERITHEIAGKGLVLANRCDPKITKIVRTIEVPGNWQSTRDRWQAFCAVLEGEEYTQEYTKFRACFHEIKTRLKREGHIKGDIDVLKFDEKDCPLFYYTEGAVIDSEKNIIRKTLSDMRDNADYARAFGGTGTKQKGLSDAETMVLGQVAAYGSFVRPSIWRTALTEVMGEWDKSGKADRMADGIIAFGRMIRSNAAKRFPSPASNQTAR